MSTWVIKASAGEGQKWRGATLIWGRRRSSSRFPLTAAERSGSVATAHGFCVGDCAVPRVSGDVSLDEYFDRPVLSHADICTRLSLAIADQKTRYRSCRRVHEPHDHDVRPILQARAKAVLDRGSRRAGPRPAAAGSRLHPAVLLRRTGIEPHGEFKSVGRGQPGETA